MKYDESLILAFGVMLLFVAGVLSILRITAEVTLVATVGGLLVVAGLGGLFV